MFEDDPAPPDDERGHPPLSLDEQALFAALSDPESSQTTEIGANPGQLLAMLDAARLHDVLPIVWRKLQTLRQGHGPGSVDLEAQMRRSGKTVLADVGLSLVLRHHAERIRSAFAEDGIRGAVVKGPVFCDRLYKVGADRPFGDIDMLMPVADRVKATRILPALGYAPILLKSWDRSDRNQEYKWVSTNGNAVLIELHNDLVHYACLRRRISFSFADLLGAGDGDPTAPTALLMTAVIHGSCGHKFHCLRFAVDILQAVRAFPDSDVGHLDRIARTMGAELELAVALSLAGRLFGDERACELAQRYSTGLTANLSTLLVSPEAVHEAMSRSPGRSHLRRKVFRLLQILSRLPGRRPVTEPLTASR